jgi:hypothetical protein
MLSIIDGTGYRVLRVDRRMNTMKNIGLIAASLLIAGTATASAHSNKARMAEQRNAIEQGRIDGSITWREGIKLRKEQADIARVKSTLESDGRLSRTDKRILFRMQDVAEGHIIAEKTDRWHRLRFLPRVGK